MSDSVISVRVSEDQKKAIQVFSDSLGMSVSSFALALMLDAVHHQRLNVGPGVLTKEQLQKAIDDTEGPGPRPS